MIERKRSSYCGCHEKRFVIKFGKVKLFQKQLLRGEDGFLLNELTAESLIKTFATDKRF